MGNITVTLVTNKQNEIKKFIDKFYEIESDISPKTFRWSSSFIYLIDTIEILSSLIDNQEKYCIESFVQFEKGTTIKITTSNLETYIRYSINQYIQKNRLLTADFLYIIIYIVIVSFMCRGRRPRRPDFKILFSFLLSLS